MKRHHFAWIVVCLLSTWVPAQVCDVDPAVERLGEPVASPSGRLRLTALGFPIAGLPTLDLVVSGGPPGADGVLVIGSGSEPLPIPGTGGLFYPAGDLRTIPFTLNARGAAEPVPTHLLDGPGLCGAEWIVQAAIEDPSSGSRHLLSNGLRVRFGGPPGAAPVVLEVESPTLQPTVTVSGFGTQPDLPLLVVGGEQTAQTTVGGDLSFSVEVTLKQNKVNTLYVMESLGGGLTGPPATLAVVHDTTAPELFIDFPPDGAVLSTPVTNVSGRVSDTLSGYEGLTVRVNGVLATVDIGIGTNGTFDLSGVDISRDGHIEVVALDTLGTGTMASVDVSYVEPEGAVLSLLPLPEVLEAEVNALLDTPIDVLVTNLQGAPLPNKLVTFEVRRSDGVLHAAEPVEPGRDVGDQLLQLFTDHLGIARAWWTLGSDAGCGNNRLEVTSQGIQGTVFVCASALPGAPDQINVSEGNGQVGAVGQLAVEPLRAWVSDACNGVAGVPVTFTVVSGEGLLTGGGLVSAPQVTVPSTATGHVQAQFQLGPEPGNHVVHADFAGNPGQPAVFVVRALATVSGASTSMEGVVQDNSGQPLLGAHCRLLIAGQPAFEVHADIHGRFVFDGLPGGGPADLYVDGGTVTAVGGRSVPADVRFPELHYVPFVVPEAANAMRAPVLLPRLRETNVVTFDTTLPHDEDAPPLELTVDGIDGLRMLVSMDTTITLPDGTRVGPDDPGTLELSLDQVHHDDVPMPMPDGAAPPFAWTLQPGGAHFDPPIRIEYPNMSGLPPGSLTNFLSFDHDTNQFEIVATGQVDPTGAIIRTDAGDGLTVSGWGCNCPPYSVTGECRTCAGTDLWSLVKSGAVLVKDMIKAFAKIDEWILCADNAVSLAEQAIDTFRDLQANGVTSCDGFQSVLQAAQAAKAAILKCVSAATNVDPGHLASKGKQISDAIGAAIDFAQANNCLGPVGQTALTVAGKLNTWAGKLFDLAEDFSLKKAAQHVACGGLDAIILYLDGCTDPGQDVSEDLAALIDDLEIKLQAYQAPDAELLALLAEVPELEVLEGELDTVAAALTTQPDLADFQFSIGSQHVTANEAGGLHVPNIAAADANPADFVSDQPQRVIGTGLIDGVVHYAFSDFFQFVNGQTEVLGGLFVTTTPPLLPEAIDLDIDDPTLEGRIPDTTTAFVTAHLPDGSSVDATGITNWTTYQSSNPSVAEVAQDGTVTSTGPGIAFVTAVNEGATAVSQVTVSPGDPGTTIVGIVVDDLGLPLAGAGVFLDSQGLSTTTIDDGSFLIPNVLAEIGDLTVRVEAGDLLGFQVGIGAVAGGFTDAGLLQLSPVIDTFFVNTTSGSVFSGAVPLQTGSEYVVIVDGTYTVWFSLGSGCGAPEPSTAYPSGHNNGATHDAEWQFAAPSGHGSCPSLPNPNGNFQLDFGSGLANQPALNPGPNPEHEYYYAVTGLGLPVRGRLVDIGYSDNAGMLKVQVIALP